MTFTRRGALFTLALSGPLLAAGIAAAQGSDWPNRAITLVAPYPPGASTDFIARIIRDPLEEQLKVPVVVENKPGAGGTTGAALVAKAAPDGYTFLVTVNAPVTMNAFMQKNFPFDPMKSFTPVIKVADVAMTLAVNAKLPINTVQDLIDYAKKNPDQKMSFGSAGVGSAHHIAGELLKQKTGLNMVHVPYKGGGPAIQDLVAGHIPISFGTTPAVMPQAQAGTIRIIALAEVKRSPDLPGVPTISETIPGVDTFTWVGIFAPLGTPKPIVDRVNAIVAETIKKPDVIAKLKTQGATAAGGSPEELQKSMKAEFDHWAKVVPSIGLTPQ
ncbi:tripartite tricarboxylate transporter substrate binding protein [Pseudorhodoplanes sp.]|uniref:Bug family tripartite tricarboxylate transporter substrate binding protein n=1 Tax=Pseudorhodoplanes sp. TaxID=1934341 RepID=UPI002BF2FE97|nr:tripartite tricarboxylate transporter substrate binding protein [Pseudorhodoplanes sp.]HWV41851.1 tripartite tricarboxylate transporter substrate binding protein [Pseudorhodoplanes sp.]